MNNSQQHGFTLIELLVVISIIGFISSTVLASLQSARTRAQNVHKSTIVRQYKNALELYYLDYGYYPEATTISLYGGWCLGADYPSDKCRINLSDPNFAYTESTEINNALRPYYPALPGNSIPTYWTLFNTLFPVDGFIYTCNTFGQTGTGRCDTVSINWYLQGEGQEKFCLNSSGFSIGGATGCSIILE
jgi:prepilin-type N-terminal cleavage/methylation domain-containing protein